MDSALITICRTWVLPFYSTQLLSKFYARCAVNRIELFNPGFSSYIAINVVSWRNNRATLTIEACRLCMENSSDGSFCRLSFPINFRFSELFLQFPCHTPNVALRGFYVVFMLNFNLNFVFSCKSEFLMNFERTM